MAAQVTDDFFENLLWNRIKEFQPAQAYDYEFWKDAFNYLKDIGWLTPAYNVPDYIVDNIAVNGDFQTEQDLKDNDLKIDDSWLKFGNYYCVDNRMGL